jgi:hypothetical protein
MASGRAIAQRAQGPEFEIPPRKVLSTGNSNPNTISLNAKN